MLASTIQFTTNPPTPTHNPRQPGAPDRPGNQGRTAPEPRQHATPTRTKHAGAPTSPHPHTKQEAEAKQACLLHQTPGKPTTPHNSARRYSHPAFRESKHPRLARTHQQPKQNQQPGTHPTHNFLRKEVIQPHLPVRLPCYDFVPITSPTFDRSP